jgi:hypothetical protein
MRYRLMASYLGAPYQAAVGPSDRDVTLFAAPPPPEEHGFSPAPGGTWRKQVRLNEIDALWESRPIGSYRGEPCLVLDDLGDRLHVAYLGMDPRRAAQLGYWQVDRGVFEVVVPRQEITDLAEERHEFPLAVLLSALSRSVPAAPQALGLPPAGAPQPPQPGPQQPPSVPQHLPTAHQLPPGPQLPAAQQAPPGPQQMPPGYQALGPQQLPAAQQLQAGPQPQLSPQAMNPQPPALPAPVPQAPAPQAPAQLVAQQPVISQPFAQQPGAQQSLGQQSLGQQPQPMAQQPNPQQPAVSQQPAIAAWHGSPAADNNGAWYGYQPPSGNGTPLNGAPHGDTGNGQLNGYANAAPNGNGQAAVTSLNGAGSLNAPVSYGSEPSYAGVATPQFAPTSASQLAQPPQPTDQATANVTTVPNPAITVSPPASAAQPSTAAKPGGAVRGRRAARKPRLAMSAVFADLVDMADIPRSAYAVDEEVTGAMCLFKTDGGYEVFSCAEDARHEVRFFEDEEAAYFYLFGVLTAEALRNGRLTPNRN